MTPLTWLIVAGAVVGLGLALIVSQLRAAPPDLGTVLERMQPRAGLGRPAAPAGLLDRIGLPLVTVRGVRIPEQQLALTGRTPSRFMATKVLCALIGLAVPPYLQLFTVLLGVHVSLLLSLGGALVLAGVLWFLPDWSLKGQAEEARTEYLHAISAYLELVAMERAADHGPAESLRRAATVGRSPAFRQFATAMEGAALDRQPPWVGLNTLGQRLGLTALTDLADIMQVSGADGASIYTALRARAHNLRSELLAAEQARAAVESERMVIPGTVLVMLMTLLIAYPAVAEMFSGGGI
ncbi:type II secretion system F family protein [Streptacidiphilus sp. PB12-B1b]|uniref:type II secretion system F family protein n=1 Tax=Streptacidiphilus sp. PB12-B1b TaxID=2705012 RepID=UPI0015F7BAE7|nr:type II secretion system F family protein [Streptacidiphilus sp. PB12-B1b]QMU76161.1 type II secretion system F family protein [Streptacidiphilus sp. PB12-B1b]